MKWSTPIEGHGLRLRSVLPEDAEFILSLRLDPTLGRYLGDTPPDPEVQRDWIRAQQERDGDLYFLIQSAAGRDLGTIGLYDITGSDAEWGRWLLTPGTQAAVGSVLLLFRVAFESLSLRSVRSRTISENRRVVSFHDSCGLRRVALETRSVRLKGVAHDVVCHELTKEQWPDLFSRLQPLAQASARFLS